MAELLLFFKIRDPIESNENWGTYLGIHWNDLTFTFFYKSYGDILTKINVFIKYLYQYFKLTLNSIQNIRLSFCFEL